MNVKRDDDQVRQTSCKLCWHYIPFGPPNKGLGICKCPTSPNLEEVVDKNNWCFEFDDEGHDAFHP